MKSAIHIIFILLSFVFCDDLQSQNKQINWITFEQLEDSLAVKPKKVFINFYADWCVYCKKMDKAAFKNEEVITELNSNYYAVKMNAECKDSITFGGKIFTNKELHQKRRPTHEIPLLLGQRKNKSFTLPLTLILDESFRVIKRDFEYISSEKMIDFLEKKIKLMSSIP